MKLILIIVILLFAGPDDDHKHDHADDHADKQPDAHTQEHADEVKLTAEAIQRNGIRVEAVSQRPLVATFTVPARVAFNAEQMAHVGTVVRGRVTEMKARLGDMVKKGDELVILESTDLAEAQSEYLQKRTAVAVAESAVAPAQQSSQRARTLYDQSQGIPLGEVQKREAELKAAEGAALTAKAALSAARDRLELLGMSASDIEKLEKTGALNPKTAIRAPIDGEVVQREITLGELVTPEDEAILVLANLSTLWVLADVPEARLGEVAVGSAAKVRLTAQREHSYEGKVSYISPALDANTRTARVRIELPNGKLVRPGMFASVELTASGGGAPVLAIPDEAVLSVEGETAVFVPVEGEENTFAKRVVEVGRPIGGMVPILAGLRAGEQVVVSGAFILKAELGKSEAGHSHDH